jgi:hypothetical protein
MVPVRWPEVWAGGAGSLDATGEHTDEVEAQPTRSEVSKVWSRNGLVFRRLARKQTKVRTPELPTTTLPPGIKMNGQEPESENRCHTKQKCDGEGFVHLPFGGYRSS